MISSDGKKLSFQHPRTSGNEFIWICECVIFFPLYLQQIIWEVVNFLGAPFLGPQTVNWFLILSGFSRYLIYIQSFWQGLACWSSPQTQVLWSFSSGICFFCLFSVVNGFNWFWIMCLCKSSQFSTTFSKFQSFSHSFSATH